MKTINQKEVYSGYMKEPMKIKPEFLIPLNSSITNIEYMQVGWSILP